MIPTAFVAGLALGRWWAVPVVGACWAVLVTAFGDCGWSCIPVAFLLGGANAAVGIALHRVLLVWLRVLRRRLR